MLFSGFSSPLSIMSSDVNNMLSPSSSEDQMYDWWARYNDAINFVCTLIFPLVKFWTPSLFTPPEEPI